MKKFTKAQKEFAESIGLDPGFAEIVWLLAKNLPAEHKPFKTVRECILATAMAIERAAEV